MSQTATMHPQALRLSAPSSFIRQGMGADESMAAMSESVHQLLARGYALPCKKAAEAFLELVQPMARFTVALHIFRPLMLDSGAEPAKRILVAYILYFMYAVRPVKDNPFYEVLCATFRAEKARSAVSETAHEQLVWVLWKILKGDGQDIDPFSPSTLARSGLPPQLRPENLSLEEEPLVVLREGERPKFDPFGDDEDDDYTAGAQTNGKDVSVMLSQEDEERQKLSDAMGLLLAARERVLSISEQRTLMPSIPQLTSPPVISSTDLRSVIVTNPPLALPLITALLAPASFSSGSSDPSLYLDILRSLPPTLPSFDLIFRLLREPTVVPDLSTGGCTTIADLVRTEVLGWFVHRCIEWCEREEGEAGRERGVRNLCRFHTSLIKHGIVDPSSDADSAEMAHFALHYSRLEEAAVLYRMLALGKL